MEKLSRTDINSVRVSQGHTSPCGAGWKLVDRQTLHCWIPQEKKKIPQKKKWILPNLTHVLSLNIYGVLIWSGVIAIRSSLEEAD